MGGAGVGDLGRARGDLEGAASFRFRFFRFFLVFFFSFVLLRPALGADRTPAGRVRGRRDVTGVARRGRRRRRGGQEVDASRARRDRGCGLRPGKRNNFFFFSASYWRRRSFFLFKQTCSPINYILTPRTSGYYSSESSGQRSVFIKSV